MKENGIFPTVIPACDLLHDKTEIGVEIEFKQASKLLVK